MKTRNLSVALLPSPGQMVALYRATSDLCSYLVTLDLGAGTAAVTGPGLSRTYNLDNEPFHSLLDSEGGSYADLALIAVVLAEAQVHDGDLS